MHNHIQTPFLTTRPLQKINGLQRVFPCAAHVTCTGTCVHISQLLPYKVAMNPSTPPYSYDMMKPLKWSVVWEFLYGLELVCPLPVGWLDHLVLKDGEMWLVWCSQPIKSTVVIPCSCTWSCPLCAGSPGQVDDASDVVNFIKIMQVSDRIVGNQLGEQ